MSLAGDRNTIVTLWLQGRNALTAINVAAAKFAATKRTPGETKEFQNNMLNEARSAITVGLPPPRGPAAARAPRCGHGGELTTGRVWLLPTFSAT